jgi:hypothetical protein
MESLEYPSRSPNLKLLEFYVWDDLKHTAYDRKQRTLQDLKLKIEIACAAIPPATTPKVCHSVACRCHQRIGVDGIYFEHL